MKSQSQILRYVSQCHFPDEDWPKVLDYCRKHFGGGKAHRSLKPLSDSTYEQFQEWIADGIGVGDVVRYGHTLGMVGGYSPSSAYLSAYLSFDGGLIIEKMDVPAYKLFKADGVETERFNALLSDRKLTFSISSSAFFEAYVPDDGDFVKIIEGKKSYLSIYKESKEGSYWFYAVIKGNKITENVSIDKSDVRLSLPLRSDNVKLLAALSLNGLEWSARDKALRKMSDKRVPKNTRYYYVTDTLDISTDIDKYTKVHDRRFKAGNYFSNFQEAFSLRERVAGLIKKTAEGKGM